MLKIAKKTEAPEMSASARMFFGLIAVFFLLCGEEGYGDYQREHVCDDDREPNSVQLKEDRKN